MRSSSKFSEQSKLGWRSLGGTMAGEMVLLSLAPLAIIAAAVVISLSGSIRQLEQGVNSTRQQMAEQVVGTTLQGQALDTMTMIDTSMRERIHDVIAWASTPTLRQ